MTRAFVIYDLWAFLSGWLTVRSSLAFCWDLGARQAKVVACLAESPTTTIFLPLPWLP